MIPFESLGANESVRADYERVLRKLKKRSAACSLGRVVSLDRGYPLVRTRAGEARAELSTVLKKSDDSIVAVGDWVAVGHPDGHEKAIIECVVPRNNEIARMKRIGRERQPRRQVLASNVDRVFVCQSLSGDGVDKMLLVRQLAAVCGCDAVPVFVFTKADLADQGVLGDALEFSRQLDCEVEVLVLAKGDEKSVESVRALCLPQTTSLLLGESGVGKSTLVNALLGQGRFETGEVRASDDRGRHTTVARRMVEIPDAGLMIDAPGLRTLQILDLDESLRKTFPDIIDMALECKFRDCTHTSEPGCAVRGEVEPVRLEAYSYLRENGQFGS